jgi:hypothetical protein
VIADLDQAAEPLARLVGADLIPVVAFAGRDDVESQGQFAAAGQGERPGAVRGAGRAGGEVPVAGRGAGSRLRCLRGLRCELA